MEQDAGWLHHHGPYVVVCLNTYSEHHTGQGGGRQIQSVVDTHIRERRPAGRCPWISRATASWSAMKRLNKEHGRGSSTLGIAR